MIFIAQEVNGRTERGTAMKLIDVDALRADYGMAEDCKDCKTGYRSCEYDRIYSKMDFCGWLDDAPTVDAVPVVHGHWIKKRYWSDGVGMGESYGYWYACSECDHEVRGDYGSCGDRFCSKCGARMY